MELLVTADDRTGALETAAVLADRGSGPTRVHAWPIADELPGSIAVVDLGTRHLSPAAARDRIETLPSADRHAHKIDSTLRGNWPEEIAAFASSGPVLLVPSLPALGRICRGGVVYEHGRPVHEGGAGTDVRRRVSSSQPAEALRVAGVATVSVLPDLATAVTWLDDARDAAVAVADAADDEAIAGLVSAWRRARPDVVLAGTSAVVGAVAPGTGAPPSMPRPVRPPVLVVCGSVHPVARAQIASAERQGFPVAAIADDITARRLGRVDALILTTEIPVGDVDEPLAVAASASLARGVDELRCACDIGALIVIGGDTAAAVFGATSLEVQGSMTPGSAWAIADGFDFPVITRAGGFGSDDGLVELIRATLHS